MHLAPPFLHPQAEAARCKEFSFQRVTRSIFLTSQPHSQNESSQYETFDSVSYLRSTQSPVSGFGVTPEGPSQAPHVLLPLCIAST